MDDLISRQGFDKFLEEAEKEAVKNRKYVFASSLNTIRGNLRNFPSAQPEPRWIPVKWREPDEEEAEYYTYMADCEMPEDEQEILVTDGKYVWKDVCYYDDGFHLDSMEDWQYITAWMPSPKPYKERREEHD